MNAVSVATCAMSPTFSASPSLLPAASASGAAAEIADRLGLGPWATQALERFMALNEKEQVLFLEILEKILAPAADQELSIDEKVASYRAELEAQANFEKSSVLRTGEEKEA